MHFPTCYLISSKQVVTDISFSPSDQCCTVTNIATVLVSTFSEAGANTSPPAVFAFCNVHIPFTVNQLITANFCGQLEYSKVCASVWCYLFEPQDSEEHFLLGWILSSLPSASPSEVSCTRSSLAC